MGTPTEAADIEALQDNVISALVSDKIQLYEAKILDILLTDDEVADIEAQAEEEMQYYMDSFQAQAESEGAEDIDARTREIFLEQLDAAEMDMDIDGFRAYIVEQFTNEALKVALKEEITRDITATDDEIQDYYAETLASQEEDYTTTPANYLNDAEAYQRMASSLSCTRRKDMCVYVRSPFHPRRKSPTIMPHCNPILKHCPHSTGGSACRVGR